MPSHSHWDRWRTRSITAAVVVEAAVAAALPHMAVAGAVAPFAEAAAAAAAFPRMAAGAAFEEAAAFRHHVVVVAAFLDFQGAGRLHR